MNRAAANDVVAKRLGNDEIVVCSLGNPTFDFFEARDRELNFYTWGCMGLASSIGLGLALAQPERKVLVLDGDGSVLMNLGSLATIASEHPANLVHVVWDNGMYELTGRQPTHTAGSADLAAVAQACGLEKVRFVEELEDFAHAVDLSLGNPGPWTIVAKVEGERSAARPRRDPVWTKLRLMDALGTPG